MPPCIGHEQHRQKAQRHAQGTHSAERFSSPASRRAWARAAAAFVALAGPLDLLVRRAAARRTAPHPFASPRSNSGRLTPRPSPPPTTGWPATTTRHKPPVRGFRICHLAPRPLSSASRTNTAPNLPRARRISGTRSPRDGGRMPMITYRTSVTRIRHAGARKADGCWTRSIREIYRRQGWDAS
jgi:hypothetical protein